MIQPTIGRRVWYWPSKTDAMQVNSVEQACDAGIVYVWGDRMVNLDVTDHGGKHHARTSVQLVQDPSEIVPGSSYAEWMPYQNAQAKKAEPPPATDAYVAVGATRFSDGAIQTEDSLAKARAEAA